jgi:hypothetical protein
MGLLFGKRLRLFKGTWINLSMWEKKGTGQLFCESIDSTCSDVLAYAATNTVDLSLTDTYPRCLLSRIFAVLRPT